MQSMQLDGLKHAIIGEMSNDLHEVCYFTLKSSIQYVYIDDSGSNPSLEISYSDSNLVNNKARIN